MNFRSLSLVIFLACLALLGFGLYLEHVMGLEPCPLCILQRYAFITAGLIALVGALHGPKRAGRVAYGVLIALAAVAGLGIALRQSWIQHHPAVAECGPGLDYMLSKFPLTRALPMIFEGHGECAEVGWRFLGLSIAEWAAIWFALLLAAGLYAALALRRRE